MAIPGTSLEPIMGTREVRHFGSACLSKTQADMKPGASLPAPAFCQEGTFFGKPLSVLIFHKTIIQSG